ncbi:hypothetical protein E3C22_20975 [Jiella endophytica]|uniref:Uncharacterized protein n=1 Tax=Jiella endophytica TaxID=2558362 RepID=A0A4Y8RAX6_9HYPH|nr:hypothetical protein [Jiella endophytica]TFF18703.1 hypothetical protein E3C22_20975 [Jiella endophytica]
MILVHVRKKARKRASEWFCALNLALFGLTLLLPGATFSAPGYAAFDAVLGEVPTGALALALGLTWAAGLVVNGVLQNLTSTVRATCCFAGSIVYALITAAYTIGAARSGLPSPGAAGNGAITILALFCLYWIGEEKGCRDDV